MAREPANSERLLVRRRGGVRSAWLGTALHLAGSWVDDDGGGVAVADFPFPSDLLEAVAARHQVLQDRARNAIFDLHPADVGLHRIAADEEPRCFDRFLRGHATVDDVEDDVV